MFIDFWASRPLAGNVSTVHPDGTMQLGEGAHDCDLIAVQVTEVTTPKPKKKRRASRKRSSGRG